MKSPGVRGEFVQDDIQILGVESVFHAPFADGSFLCEVDTLAIRSDIKSPVSDDFPHLLRLFFEAAGVEDDVGFQLRLGEEDDQAFRSGGFRDREGSDHHAFAFLHLVFLDHSARPKLVDFSAGSGRDQVAVSIHGDDHFHGDLAPHCEVVLFDVDELTVNVELHDRRRFRFFARFLVLLRTEGRSGTDQEGNEDENEGEPSVFQDALHAFLFLNYRLNWTVSTISPQLEWC